MNCLTKPQSSHGDNFQRNLWVMYDVNCLVNKKGASLTSQTTQKVLEDLQYYKLLTKMINIKC